jgi:hypothetical protein
VKYLNTYGDQRQLAFCAFCGGRTGTRDHCPSRVFLDEPYPENLPVVPACSQCNQGFSADEEYLACLISCVLAGSTEPSSIARVKIARILENKPALRNRVEQSRQESSAGMFFKIESERVISVLTKLAQGHALYELHEPCAYTPTHIVVKPLLLMTEADRFQFEASSQSGIAPWPEVGSRAMQRLIMPDNDMSNGWLEVQPGRYRFSASIVDGIEIRIVIHEYLAGLVRWP